MFCLILALALYSAIFSSEDADNVNYAGSRRKLLSMIHSYTIVYDIANWELMRTKLESTKNELKYVTSSLEDKCPGITAVTTQLLSCSEQYISAVHLFYKRRHGIQKNDPRTWETLALRSPELKAAYESVNASKHAALAAYNLSLHARTDDDWLEVVQLWTPMGDMFSKGLDNAEWCVGCILNSDRRRSWIISGITIAAVVCGGVLCIAIGLSISFMRMGEVAQCVMFNLNHELKGIVISVLTVMDELPEAVPASATSSVSRLQRLLRHLCHSLDSIPYRCGIVSTCDDTLAVIDMRTDIFDTLVDVLQQISNNQIIVDPLQGDIVIRGHACLLYHLVYQICRNAYLHGVDPRVRFDLESRCLIVTNRHGTKSAELVDLPEKRALEICMSGAIGTNASSGQGLRDILYLATVMRIGFRLSFLKEEVRCILQFAEDQVVSFTPPSEIRLQLPPSVEEEHVAPTAGEPDAEAHVQFALCSLDDESIPRRSGLGIYNALNGKAMTSKPHNWDPAAWLSRSECEHERLLITGHQPPDVIQLTEWMRRLAHTEYLVVALIDFSLNYPGSVEHNGDEIMATLKRTFQGAPNVWIFMRTGNDDPVSVQRYIKMGADGVFPKSMPAKIIAAEIKKACRNSIEL